jgi:hypothetical protein
VISELHEFISLLNFQAGNSQNTNLDLVTLDADLLCSVFPY